MQKMRDELDCWEQCGARARFWWRDDDADIPCSSFNLLMQLARDFNPVVAAIPGRLRHEAATMMSASGVSVVQHGWDHANNSTSKQPSEFPEDVNLDNALSNLKYGANILQSYFGDHFFPFLVPPWHNCCSQVVNNLDSIGLLGVSSGISRTCPVPGPLDISIDINNWSNGGKFIGNEELVRRVVVLLRRRRTGLLPLHRPIGILSHHKRFDSDAISALEILFSALLQHPAVEWLNAEALFFGARTLSSADQSMKNIGRAE